MKTFKRIAGKLSKREAAVPQIPNEQLNEMAADWHRAMSDQIEQGILADSTVRTYERGLEQFMDWMDSEGINQMSPDVLNKWRGAMRRQGLSPSKVEITYAGVVTRFGSSLITLERFYRWSGSSGTLVRLVRKLFGKPVG